MAHSIALRLAELGLVLPTPPAPAANYVPFVRSGNLLFVAGQLPMVSGQVQFTGKLGATVSVEDGIAAARLCAINILAQANAALEGDLTRLVACVRLGGFVACTPDFTQHPAIINGASNLIFDVMGPAGRHARAAVGAPSLPLDAAVEVEAVLEIM